MVGTVLHVNVSPGGLPKRPIGEGFIDTLGVKGDACANTKTHGGPLQAILLVCQEGIDELVTEGYPLYPGALGENLTVQGLDRRQVRAGQRYRVGDAVIEITRLRGPCQKLDVYGQGIQKAVFDERVIAGDASSEKWGLGGFYASVMRPGRVSPGAPVALLDEAV